MSAICFEYDPRGWNRDLWLYLVTAFDCEAYERNRPDDSSGTNNFGVIAINGMKDLPTGRPLVLLQPKSGTELQGQTNLIDYVHKPDAIYVFGSDVGNIGDEDFEGLDYELVYIPQADDVVQNEIWSHQAGAILLYDVLAKS